jgi:antitoxin MazE
MTTTVQKWGNSLAVRLPQAVAEKAQFARGSKIEFDVTPGEVKIHAVKPMRRRRSPVTVAKMLAGYKGAYPHRKTFEDPPVGREIL